MLRSIFGSKAVRVIQAHELESLNPGQTLLLDVRTEDEFRQGSIEGAANIPVEELSRRLADVPKNKRLVVFCASGRRSHLAARILMRRGFGDVRNLNGGYLAYVQARLGQSTAERLAPDSMDSGEERQKMGTEEDLVQAKATIQR